MSAEDYHDVPGIGSGYGFGKNGYGSHPYPCQFCGAAISFSNRKPYNADGTAHRCKSDRREKPSSPPPATQDATLYALAAMNAIINGQIQVGGVDHIHRMNFYDVADAAWQVAVAMVGAEKNHRHELAANDQEGP